jgi:predicted aconitase with swiveling domain
MALIRAEPLLAGRARGPLLRLVQPLSFWGGVDAGSGMIVDPDSDAYGQTVGGTVLALAATRGSSSSSAVLLELAYRRLAPAALLMAEPDAILLVGAIVGREMGWPAPAVLRLDATAQAALPAGALLEIDAEGEIAAQ